MEKWLLISHCQTFGLANSFNLLAPGIEVEALDIWKYRENLAETTQRIGGYNRILILPEVMETPGADFSSARRVDHIPGVIFRGYHPDLCYANANGYALHGPTGAYHSMIAVAAFNRGLSVEDTLRLYNAKTYEICGYMDLWPSERDNLLTAFGALNINIASDFRRWAGAGAFMYSINHTRIACLYDIARAYLRRESIDVLKNDILPSDNLVQSACFAVYPEIGENVGAEGSYAFKRVDSYKLLDLEEFIRGSFEAYAGFGAGNIVPDHTVGHRYPALDALF